MACLIPSRYIDVHAKQVVWSEASQGFDQLFFAGECDHVIFCVCWGRKKCSHFDKRLVLQVLIRSSPSSTTHFRSDFTTDLIPWLPMKHAVKTTKLQNYALRNETATNSEYYTIDEQK